MKLFYDFIKFGARIRTKLTKPKINDYLSKATGEAIKN